MSQGVCLHLAPDEGAPRAARTGVVDGLQLEDGLAENTALLVSEAVTNSVLHAGLAPDDRIRVEAWWTGEHVRVEVCDEGGGMGSASRADPGRDGGRGLNIISSLAARWGVRCDGSTQIWFELAA